MTALKFNKVKNLPTSGYNIGDVFFVSSEKNIYIRTVSGWEKYDGGFTTVISGKVDKTLNAKTIEAIKLYTDNTKEHKKANLDNIAAYKANLQTLGIDTTNGYSFLARIGNYDAIMCTPDPGNENGGWSGILTTLGAHYLEFIDSDGTYTEYMYDYVSKSKNSKTLEAITIKTDNSTASKASNVAAIKAYVDNLKLLGVDVTKGYIIPCKFDNSRNGFIMQEVAGNCAGFIKDDDNYFGGGFVLIKPDGTYQTLNLLTVGEYNSLTTTSKYIVKAINEVNALAKGKQDKLTSGTNIKTINGKSLLGSGDIAISGGGDVTAAGDNTFTGNNVFSGIAIADILDGTQYQITGDNGVLSFTKNATNDDIEISGVATPTYSNSAANKKYVDDKVVAAGGVANKLTVTNFDSNSGRPISIQDTSKNDVLYVKNDVGIAYDGPMLTIKKYNNGSGSANNDEYATNICGKGIEIGSAVNGNYDYGTVISNGEILLYGSPVITESDLMNLLPIGTRSISSTTTERISLFSGTSTSHRIILANPSGTKTVDLPQAPYDGETFEIIRIAGVSFILTNNSGRAMQKCTGTTTVTSMTISSAGKYTCIYSSSASRWYVMRDDFVSF